MSEGPQYLYQLRPTRPEMLVDGLTEDEEIAVDEHYAYLKGLTDWGVVVLAGRTLEVGERGFGLVVFNASSEDEAESLMRADPAIRAGVLSAELFPFNLALYAVNEA